MAAYSPTSGNMKGFRNGYTIGFEDGINEVDAILLESIGTEESSSIDAISKVNAMLASNLVDKGIPAEATETTATLAEMVSDIADPQASYDEGYNTGLEEGKLQSNSFWNTWTQNGTNLSYLWYNAPTRGFRDYDNVNKRAVPLPLPDTSKVTNMVAMFRECDLYQVPDVIDTSSATNTSYMFANVAGQASGIFSYGRNMSHIVLDMTNVVDANRMFVQCFCGKLPTLLNMQNVRNLERFCYQSQYLTEINLPDTSGATKFTDFAGSSNGAITKVVLNVTSGENFKNAFDGLINCTDFTPIGTFKASVSFRYSKKLTSASWERIFNALADLTGQTACTLTIPAGLDETIIPSALREAARTKNWTIAEA